MAGNDYAVGVDLVAGRVGGPLFERVQNVVDCPLHVGQHASIVEPKNAIALPS
jgi:hypothetical protein